MERNPGCATPTYWSRTLPSDYCGRFIFLLVKFTVKSWQHGLLALRFAKDLTRDQNCIGMDIDVTFDDITRQQQIRRAVSSFVGRHQPLQYSVLHGVGTVANALSVGDMATNFADRFHVDVAALVQTEDNIGLPELHRSARMIWNEVNVPSPRLEIYAKANPKCFAPFGGAVRDQTDRCNHNVDENCS